MPLYLKPFNRCPAMGQGWGKLVAHAKSMAGFCPAHLLSYAYSESRC